MADGEVDLGSLSDLSELSDPGVDENGAGIGGSGDGPSTSDGRLAGGPASSGQGGSPNVLLYDLHSHLPDWKTLDALHVERPAPFAALRSTVEFVARAAATVTSPCRKRARAVPGSLPDDALVAGRPHPDVVARVAERAPFNVAISPSREAVAVVHPRSVTFYTAANADFRAPVSWDGPREFASAPRWRCSLWADDEHLLTLSRNTASADDYSFDLARLRISGRVVDAVSSVRLGIHPSEAILAAAMLPNAGLVLLSAAGYLLLIPMRPGSPLRPTAAIRSPRLDCHVDAVCLEAAPQAGLLAVGGTGFTGDGNGTTPAVAAPVLSVWRVVTAAADGQGSAFELVHTTGEHDAPSLVKRRWFEALRQRASAVNLACVTALSFSPTGTQLAVVDTANVLTVYNTRTWTPAHVFPSDRLFQLWNATAGSEPTAQTAAERIAAAVVVDLTWWSSDALALGFACGNVVVTSVYGLRNMLGRFAERFEGRPQLVSTARGRLFVLEAEEERVRVPAEWGNPMLHLVGGSRGRRGQPSRNDGDGAADESDVGGEANADVGVGDDSSLMPARPRRCGSTAVDLFRVTLMLLTRDETWGRPEWQYCVVPKLTHRLASLVEMSPAELFTRKLALREYGHALALARTYDDLNADHVHQAQFRDARVSKTAIADHLRRIRDAAWVLRECASRLPDTREATQLLLEYGRNLAANPPPGSDLDPDVASAYALVFRQYMRRLKTYASINKATRAFNSAEFGVFRSQPVRAIALDYARTSRIDALRRLLADYADTPASVRLQVLAAIPETTSPNEYADLLPRVGSADKGKASSGSNGGRRAKAAAKEEEEEEVFLGLAASLDAEFFDQHAIQCPLDYVASDPLDDDDAAEADDLEAWYMGRALEIEELSGLVSHALSFAALAIARGCVSDESAALHADLELLEALVYDCALDLSLADLGELSAKARVALLLADCTPDTIVGLIRTRVAPFFDVQAQTGFDLLYAFLVDAAPHNLGLAAQVVRASRADAPTADRLIVDEIALLKLALDTIYMCEQTGAEAVEMMADMYVCLPEHDANRSDAGSPFYHDLHRRANALDDHITALQVFLRYGLAHPISAITQGNAASDLVATLVTRVPQQHPGRFATLAAWQKLLRDVRGLAELSPALTPSYCVGTVVESAFFAEKASFVHKLAGSVLSDEDLASIAASVASRFVDSSSSARDRMMALAEETLEVVSGLDGESPWAPVQAERAFVRSLQALADGGLDVIPPQVRAAVDRLEFVRRWLACDQAAFARVTEVVRVARGLGLAGRDDDLHLLIGESAAEAADAAVLGDMCKRLIGSRHAPAWRLARRAVDIIGPSNPRLALRCADFALLHCSTDAFDGLLRARNTLELETMAVVGRNGSDTHPGRSPIYALGDDDLDDGATNDNDADPMALFAIGPMPGAAFAWRQLNATGEASGGGDHWNDDALIEKAEAAAAVGDAELCLGLLLALADPMRAPEMAPEPTPPHNLADRLVCRSLALRALAATLPDDRIQNPTMGPDQAALEAGAEASAIPRSFGGRHPALVQAPLPQLIAALHDVGDGAGASGVALVEAALAHAALVADSSRGEVVTALLPDVAVGRFASDAAYRRDVAIRLAELGTDDGLTVAAQMAVDYADDVDLARLAAAHLCVAYGDEQQGGDSIRHRFEPLERALLASPLRLRDALHEASVVTHIDGTDYAKLEHYYTLLADSYAMPDGGGRDGSPADGAGGEAAVQAHLKALELLRTVPGALKTVDYRNLVSADEGLGELAAALGPDNVRRWGKVIHQIPMAEPMTKADVFELYVRDAFGSGHVTTADDYAEVKPLLADVEPTALVDALDLTLRDAALEVDLRAAIAKDVAAVVAKAGNSDDLAARIKARSKHLRKVGKLHKNRSLRGADVAPYIASYDATLGEHPAVEALLWRMVHDGVPLSSLTLFISAVGWNDTPENVVVGAVMDLAGSPAMERLVGDLLSVDEEAYVEAKSAVLDAIRDRAAAAEGSDPAVRVQCLALLADYQPAPGVNDSLLVAKIKSGLVSLGAAARAVVEAEGEATEAAASSSFVTPAFWQRLVACVSEVESADEAERLVNVGFDVVRLRESDEVDAEGVLAPPDWGALMGAIASLDLDGCPELVCRVRNNPAVATGLSAGVEADILAALADRHPVAALRFGLCSVHDETRSAAVELLSASGAGLEGGAVLADLVLRAGAFHVVADAAWAVDHLLDPPAEVPGGADLFMPFLNPRDIAGSILFNAALLVLRGNAVRAASLVVRHRGIEPSLVTLDLALSLLRRTFTRGLGDLRAAGAVGATGPEAVTYSSYGAAGAVVCHTQAGLVAVVEEAVGLL